MTDLELIIKAIREAGTMALAVLKQGVTVWSKPDGSVVTDGDLVIDQFLKTVLTTARPDYGWLSEESPDDPARLATRRCWIVDPIDGTRSYSRQSTNWCIGIGLVENGRPIESAVFHPQLDRLYTASKGKGAYNNGERLHIGAQPPGLKDMRVMGTKSLVSKLTRHGAENVPSNDMPLLARFAMLASRELDAAISAPTKYDWDLAAGELICREAGGEVTGTRGETMNYNQPARCQPGLVAASPARHKAILEILEQS